MTTASTTLAELIETASHRHNGASGRRLAELAQKAGHDVSHATLNRIRRGAYESTPTPQTIKAIAYLAGLPEPAAFAAAATEAELETQRATRRFVELSFRADDVEAHARAADGYTETDDIAEILEVLDTLVDSVYELTRTAQKVAATNVGGPRRLAELKAEAQEALRRNRSRQSLPTGEPVGPLVVGEGSFTGQQSTEDDAMLRAARRAQQRATPVDRRT
ncbi:helix-turn-helix domain-containing protein [Nocardia sp. SYP-A9097]|uniref:helix-turn-helix domain-containing protein n=1 Tax=Nocardia sp. SYP-A9097 TaxID=2663237 RepID=UPI0013243E78|nr:helix-turn-helix domain-containing protein [Nocardia sp. SYP-A9097]MRH86052.1 helix-turn-helix domain-containing protein [Nocardia sp. SYP-A9097]